MLTNYIADLTAKLTTAQANLTRACDLLPEAVRGRAGEYVRAVAKNRISLSEQALLPALDLVPPSMEFGYYPLRLGAASELLTREMSLSPRQPLGVQPVLPVVETSYKVLPTTLSWWHKGLVIQVDCPRISDNARIGLSVDLPGFEQHVPADGYQRFLAAIAYIPDTTVAPGLAHEQYVALQQHAVLELQAFLDEHAPEFRGSPSVDLLTSYLRCKLGMPFSVSARAPGKYCVTLFNGKHHVYGPTMDSVSIAIHRDGPQDQHWCDLGEYPHTVEEGWMALVAVFRQKLNY